MPNPTQPNPTRKADSPAPAAKPSPRVGASSAPKPRRDVGLAWLVLAGLLLCAAIPLSIDLSVPATWTAREAFTSAVSIETHQRQTPINDAETSLDAWTPVYQGKSRWDMPPGSIWLHQLMSIGVDSSSAASDPDTAHTLLVRGRLASVGMALLFVAAVFWAGHSIGGITTAALSAMVALTMPLLIGFGRHATPDIAGLAWSTLSIAAALWAMRPLRAAPGLPRQFTGWLISGVSLGLSTLTIGAHAVPTTLLCTVVLAMLCPRRLGHIMGLLASSAVAALTVTPWVLHVHDLDPNLWQRWFSELTPDLFQNGFLETLRRAGWRLSLSATLCGLWLIWLIPAVSQPFSTSTGKSRKKMLLGWGWLMTAGLLVALAPGQTRFATLLITVAPASLAIGTVTQQFHDLSAEGRHARLWLVSRWIAILFMAGFALALPALGYLLNHRPDVVAVLPALERPLLASMHWSFYAGAALALLLVTVLTVRFSVGHHPGRAVASLALWLMVAYCIALIPLARGPLLSRAAELPTQTQPLIDNAQP